LMPLKDEVRLGAAGTPGTYLVTTVCSG